VPVVAIFTKFDALVIKSFGTLKGEGMPIPKARVLAQDRAKVDLKAYEEQLVTKKYPPKSMVLLQSKKFDLYSIKSTILNNVL